MTTARCYFWGPPIFSNFGDLVSLTLLRKMAGVEAEWAPPEQANIVVSGSVLDSMPPNWAGVVAGAGVLLEQSRIDLSNANVVALRGPLTLDRVTLAPGSTPVIGDPALLASDLVNPRQTYDLGVVPHWSDATLYPRFQHMNPLPIPTTGDPLEIMRLIGSCKKIVTSSLHGMVIADAFGITRRVEKFPAMLTDPKQGGEFKFHDHAASLGMEMRWGVHGGEIAPARAVLRAQAQLFNVFSELGADFAGT